MTLNPPPPPKSQAERVYAKFGGPARMAIALRELAARGLVAKKYAPSTVYRWGYSKAAGGTGGVIPSSAWADIMVLAKRRGVLITTDDLFPGEK